MLTFILSGSANYLAPPNFFDPDASLETVDLNEDDSGLERFLSEDLLYDVSPFPKDDEDTLLPLRSDSKEGSRETLQGEIQLAEDCAFNETITNPTALNLPSSLEDEDIEECEHNNKPSFIKEKVDIQAENSVVSRSESIYYTPDNTLERLSDLTLN